MDREELDRQLKEQGKNIELQTDKFSSGRKKLAAGKQAGKQSGIFLFLPTDRTEKSGGAAGNQKYGCCTGGQRSWSGCRWDHDAGL